MDFCFPETIAGGPGLPSTLTPSKGSGATKLALLGEPSPCAAPKPEGVGGDAPGAVGAAGAPFEGVIPAVMIWASVR